MMNRTVEAAIKRRLILKYNKKDEYKNEGELSIVEFVYANDVSREVLEEAVEYMRKKALDLVYNVVEYNLDMIYNRDKTLTNALEKQARGELYPVQVDELIRVRDVEE